ncbi:MAG: glycosyltransferase [Leptolyngbya sp. BL-A-14]
MTDSTTPEASPPRPLLSLCMIVKNESEHLARCLTSAQSYVDEIVVVDTGSQDDTVAIAQQFGATLFHFDWCDDFAAARNFSLEKVNAAWVLILDADETLVVETDALQQQLSAAPPEVMGYALTRTEITLLEGDLSGGFHIRLFRNDPCLRYVGRYHEQLRHQNGKPLAIDTFHELKILHYGNSDEQAVLKKTIERDIPLLEKMRQEQGLNLWLLDCLARNYIRTEQPDYAQECYAEAFDRLLPHLLSGEAPTDFFWVPTLMCELGWRSLDAEDLETTRLLVQRGLEWCPPHAPLNNLAGEVLLMLGFPLGAIAYFETSLRLGQEGTYNQTDPCPKSAITTAPACGLGRAYQQLGQPEQAIACFELALSFDANCAIAQQFLQEVRSQEPAVGS